MSMSCSTTLRILFIAASTSAAVVATGCGGEEGAGKPPPGRVAAQQKIKDTDIDHDAEPPPPPPGGRDVVIYRNGKAGPSTENEARAAGLTVVDLSNFWVPYVFSESDDPNGPRLKNNFRPIFRKLANDWHYESRTMAAAREIVERQIARAQAAKIAELRAQGLSEEEIQAVINPEKAAADKAADKAATDKDAGAAKPEPAKEEPKDAGLDDEFAGGLGEADNFLELFGIPPSLTVLRKRAISEIDRPCFKDVDFDAIRRFDGFIAYQGSKETVEADAKKGRAMSQKMRAEMERLGVTDPAALAERTDAKISSGLVRQAIRWEALANAQKMLACEGLFEQQGPRVSFWKGGLDWKTHVALVRFEHKNRIFGWGFFGRETLVALGRTPAERLFDAFVRALAERLIDATHIIEDGTAVGPDGQPATYKNEKGEVVPVPNLVAEHVAAALQHMGLETPDKVVEFLKSRDDAAFDQLFVALPLSPKPPYYAETMDIFAVIDRGDVWYDYPYTLDGKHKAQPRKRMPTLSLFTRWNGQEIPLFTTNTTIGGWRGELAPDGYEYFKYKNSDVGPRVWKDIVAGPVWLPPDTTPMSDLVKKVSYKGREVKVPNYDEFGPWYASAYGLVAGFHVREVQRPSGKLDYFDNGIRSHGSVDYNSILRRFSHGCHRLYNHIAIRVFDFVLRHRPFTRVGEQPAGYSHEFTTEDDEKYTISLESKGYKYELVQPVPVNVLEGRVRGPQRTPLEIYMPKPDEEYGTDAQFLPPGYRAAMEADGGVAAAPVSAPVAAPAPAAPAAPNKPGPRK